MLQPMLMNQLADNGLFLQTSAGKALLQNPLGFIDVGARGGAHTIVEPIARLTSVLGFEPDLAECERLSKIKEVYEPWAGFHLEPIALGAKKGMDELVLCSQATNHSLLEPNLDFNHRYQMTKWQIVGREKLETELLDTILFEKLHTNNHWGEFIKLDTQGTEFEILQGAKRTLTERTVAIMTEVSFCEIYKKQKLFSDIELSLREHGFSFYGFTKIHTRSCKLLDKQKHVTAERLFYADAVFFKDPLPGPSYLKNVDDRGLYVLFTTALLLGYYDFALELASKTWAKNDEAELNKIKFLILQLTELPPSKTQHSIEELAKHIEQKPELANITVGGFIDERRRLCNYDDVLNISAGLKGF